MNCLLISHILILLEIRPNQYELIMFYIIQKTKRDNKVIVKYLFFKIFSNKRHEDIKVKKE